MARRATALLLSVAIFSVLASPAQAQRGSAPRTAVLPLATLIPNFGVVTDNLWRGSAPSDAALEELASRGIKTIVDLRLNVHRSEHEQLAAEKLGMNYFPLPMGYGQPSDAQVQKFLAITQNPDLQPVYVHCRQGADRTGTLVAAYRIFEQKWSLDRVYSEMRLHHFKPWLFTLKRAVRSYCADQEV